MTSGLARLGDLAYRRRGRMVLAWIAAIPGLILSYYALLLYIPMARDALREGRSAQARVISST